MPSPVTRALDKLTKEIEKDLIDHGTGLLEDVGKALRLTLYKQRGIEIPPQDTTANKDSIPETRGPTSVRPLDTISRQPSTSANDKPKAEEI